jgi:hypothetical protein
VVAVVGLSGGLGGAQYGAAAGQWVAGSARGGR